jgi:hypothetical protein
MQAPLIDSFEPSTSSGGCFKTERKSDRRTSAASRVVRRASAFSEIVARSPRAHRSAPTVAVETLARKPADVLGAEARFLLNELFLLNKLLLASVTGQGCLTAVS